MNRLLAPSYFRTSDLPYTVLEGATYSHLLYPSLNSDIAVRRDLMLRWAGCQITQLAATKVLFPILVSVVNPAQVKFFSKTTLRRGKTDSMDAEIIARFGLTVQPKLWTPPQPVWIEIKQLVRERETVLQQLSRERNHLRLSSTLIILLP